MSNDSISDSPVVKSILSYKYLSSIDLEACECFLQKPLICFSCSSGSFNLTLWRCYCRLLSASLPNNFMCRSLHIGLNKQSGYAGRMFCVDKSLHLYFLTFILWYKHFAKWCLHIFFAGIWLRSVPSLHEYFQISLYPKWPIRIKKKNTGMFYLQRRITSLLGFISGLQGAKFLSSKFLKKASECFVYIWRMKASWMSQQYRLARSHLILKLINIPVHRSITAPDSSLVWER